MARVVVPKKIVTVKREREDFGGFFVGAILLGVASDFYFRSWPIGSLIGVGVGFILVALARLMRR